jgi:uncharacterized membrane protein
MNKQSEFTGIKSTAAIGTHPLHPMVIPFPIAFLIGAAVSDIVFASTKIPFWAGTSYWLLLSGLIMGGVAGVGGMIDFFTIRRARNPSGWVHAIGNISAVVITLINFLLRLDNPTTSVVPAGITLSIVTGVLLLITGWFGGELAYRYAIGVQPRTEALKISKPQDYSKAA